MDKFNKATFTKGFSCVNVLSNIIELVFKMIIGDSYQGAENIRAEEVLCHCVPLSKSSL